MINLGLAGFGAGAVGRGVPGLYSMLTRGRPKVSPTSSVPQELPVRIFTPPPKPQPVVEEEFAEEPIDGEPMEGDIAEMKMATLRSLSKQLAKEAGSVFDANPSGGVTWWQVPAGLTAAAGGLYGGWSLIDSLIDKKRHADIQDELGTAKQEYEQALNDQYMASAMAKDASISARLDALFDQLEKQAEGQEWQWPRLGYELPVKKLVPNAVGDVAHGLGGAYTTAALLSLLGGGYAGYQWARRRSTAKQVDDALKRRARERNAPMPVYALPEVVPAQPAAASA